MRGNDRNWQSESVHRSYDWYRGLVDNILSLALVIDNWRCRTVGDAIQSTALLSQQIQSEEEESDNAEIKLDCLSLLLYRWRGTHCVPAVARAYLHSLPSVHFVRQLLTFKYD